MRLKSIGISLMGLLCVSLASANLVMGLDEPKDKEAANLRFEKLLADAMKDLDKVDWKSLRESFSRTTHYQPYSIVVTEKLKEIVKSLGDVDPKKTEADLIELIERERFMRIDTMYMLMTLYEKTDQASKTEKYKKLIKGILGVLDYPKSGTDFENAIPILFIQEEYLVTTNMPFKSRGLTINKGRRFDVFELTAEGNQPGKKVYFNIDLTRNAKSLLDK